MKALHRTRSRLVLVACLAVGIGVGSVACAQPTADASSVQRLFEARYRAWLRYAYGLIERGDPRTLDESGASGAWMFDNEPFRQIGAMGVPSLPCIVAQIEAGDAMMADAASRITGIEFHWHCTDVKVGKSWTIDELPGLGPRPQAAGGDPVVWVYWWKEGRFHAAEQLAALYAQRQAAMHRGQTEEAAAKWERIRGLGIAALPGLVVKIGQGESNLTPIMSYWTDGAVKADAKAQDCTKWWEHHMGEWTLPAKTNLPPPVTVKYDYAGRLAPEE